MNNLSKPKALITGASSGIGKATALEFAKAGIDVALVSRSKDKLTAVASAAEATGVKAKAYELDLAEVGQVSEQIQLIASDFGGIDILVNNAGINMKKPALEVTDEDFDRIVHTNLNSVFSLTRACAQRMMARQQGSIIMISSMAAYYGIDRVAAYGDADVQRLLEDASIVRNRAKIEASINNARVAADLDASLDDLLWSFAPQTPRPRPVTMADLPAITDESKAMAKELKRRGFKFFGPTTAYALMQATGMVDDHVEGCWRAG